MENENFIHTDPGDEQEYVTPITEQQPPWLKPYSIKDVVSEFFSDDFSDKVIIVKKGAAVGSSV